LNKNQKIIVSMLVLAILAFSTALMAARATTYTSYSSLPFSQGNLVTPGQLTVAGSSTVGPIATEEITPPTGTQGFNAYFNGLITKNSWPSTWALSSSVSLATQGSGTAIPALDSATADVGEMSRPPQNSSAEYLQGAMNNLQLYAVGIDSVAIVLSPDMTWFPSGVTTQQVAQIFAMATPNNQNEGTSSNATATGLYTTWGDFLQAYYKVSGLAAVQAQNPAVTSAIYNEQIQRAVRDPTSGTYDCFNNYFAVPNNYQFEHKTNSVVDGAENLGPYTYCQENINIYNTVSAGSLATSSDYIGFISLGYLQTYGHMIGVSIEFNTSNVPNSYIAYQGGTFVPSAPIAPTVPNVILGYSGQSPPGATGAYAAWRWLWEVLPGTITDTNPNMAAGVWVAYMKETNTTNSGAGDFVSDNSYIELDRCDMAGATPIDANLAAHGTANGLLGSQTQTIPDGNVNFHDITYFVSAYINYYTNGIYNPYADMNADGAINFHDLTSFVATYIAYYQNYV
jgi:ABC-type phosphate transport system substrate-binding protein